MKRACVLLGIVVVVLGSGGVAWANSGSITDVHPVTGGQVAATYTSTSTTCTSYGFCGWFPKAVQVPVAQACAVSSDLTYVGSYRDAPGTQVGTDTFYPASALPIRLCLYISGPDAADVLAAEAVYPSSGLGAASDPPTTPVPPLTIAEARANVPVALRERYGGRFTVRRRFMRACYRLSTEKVRCRVRWDHGRWRYRGTITMSNDPADPANSFLYTTSIRRARLRAASAPASPSQPSPPPASSGCNPNYSGVCLPLTGDVDCGEISARDFTVVGSDPFRLDGDNDGIACES